MSSQGPPVVGTVPISPPSINTPFVVFKDGYGFLMPNSLEFLQLIFAGIAGTGGIIEQITQNFFTNNLSILGGLTEPEALLAPTDVPVAASVAALKAEIASLRVKVDALQAPRQVPDALPPFLLAPRAERDSPSVIPWVPVVVGSTTAGAQTYSAQFGFYAQLGPFMVGLYDVTLASLDAAAAGNTLITGMQIPANTNWSRFAGWLSFASGITYSGLGFSELGCFVAAGSNQITMIETGSGTGATILPITKLSNTTRLCGGVLYAI